MNNFDIIIFGGGTAGCACAWNCARLGLKTLLLEKENYLGGTMTGALVIPVMKSGENQINTDFYNELTRRMRSAGAQVTYQGNQGWFNPFILKDVLYSMLNHACVNIQMLSEPIETIYTDKNLISKVQMLSVSIGARYYVDATGDLNFCKKLNCEFLPQTQDLPPKSLRFIMDGVDLKTFGNWLLQTDSDREVTTVENIDGQIHLSTAYTWDSDKHWALAPYFEHAVTNGELKSSDVNYFQVFSVAGMSGGLAFNCPRLINPDDGYSEGVEAIKRIADFCINTFPGFEKAKVFKIADKIGVRASRRIKGKYIYTIDDLRCGKKFDHPAVISNYPVDVHSAQKNSSTLEKTGEYQLPIESLMSCDYDNLFVAGRGLSADEMAQGALRVQASCFAMGEAVAKWIAQH